MIHRAANDLALAPKRSYVVGDQNVDRELALRVGATPVLVRSNGEQVLVDDVSHSTGFRQSKISRRVDIGAPLRRRSRILNYEVSRYRCCRIYRFASG